MYQSHKGWTSNSDNTIGRYVAMEYQSHKGWTSNYTPVLLRVPLVYQSHKGWTSNLLNIKLNLNYKEYQSHKGWTSNNINDLSWDELTNRINPTRGGRQTLYLQLCIYSLYFVSIPQGVDVKRLNSKVLKEEIGCINPTRGGRQTQYRHSPRSRPGSINPTRGGRQTSMWIYSSVAGAVYQSHKGWTSNFGGSVIDIGVGDVSIPQGVDVKPHSTREMAALLRYQSHKGWTSNFFCVISSSIIDSINPTRGGRQTLQYWP